MGKRDWNDLEPLNNYYDLKKEKTDTLVRMKKQIDINQKTDDIVWKSKQNYKELIQRILIYYGKGEKEQGVSKEENKIEKLKNMYNYDEYIPLESENFHKEFPLKTNEEMKNRIYRIFVIIDSFLCSVKTLI